MKRLHRNTGFPATCEAVDRRGFLLAVTSHPVSLPLITDCIFNQRVLWVELRLSQTEMMRFHGNDVEVGGVKGVSFQFLLITFVFCLKESKSESISGTSKCLE